MAEEQEQAPTGPRTVTMYDRKGQAVAVPEDKVVDAYRSGELGLAEGQQVVLRKGREQVALSGAEAGALLDSREGALYEGGSSEGYQEQELKKEYSGFSGQARSFAAGAARGLTLGLSDVAISELGGDDARQELQRLQRYGQGAGIAGEAVGTLGGALLSGGSGLLAKGASAGVRAGAAVGGLAERAAVRSGLALGLREGGAAARALGTAASFGAEGALYAAGGELGRQAVANERYDGEKLVAAGLHGALVGGALGGAGSLAATGARVAASKVAGASLDAAITLAERVGGKASTVAKEGELLEQKIARLVDAVSPGGAGSFGAEKALKSTGGTQKQLGKVLDASEGVQRKAQEILEQRIPEALGRERGAILSRPEMAEAMPAVLRQEGERIGGSLRALDAAGAEGPSVRRIVDEARSTILADLKANVFAKREADALEGAINGLRGYEGGAMKFEGLHELSSRLGETIRGKMGVEAEALGKFRGLIEAEIERAGDAAASKVGGGFADAYREAKRGYAAAKMLDKAIKTGVERETANRSLGLSEQLGMLGGGGLGATVGGMVAGPAGAAVGGAVGGMAQAYANNLARRYGDQAAAFLLKEVAAGRPLSEAAGRVVDQVVGQSVQALVRRAAGGAERVAGGAARGGRLQLQERGREALDDRAAAREYDRAVERLAAAPPAEPPQGVPPEAAASAAETEARRRAFLQTKIPRTPGAGVGLQPHLSKLRPPIEEQRRFLAYARAADDPLSVLDDLRRGRLPREGIEVLRELYPQMYADVRARATELLAEQKEKIDPAAARRIAALLGVVARPADDPAFVATIQAGYAAQTGGTGAPPGGPPRRPVDTARIYRGEGEGE